jgi:hypothetical protein
MRTLAFASIALLFSGLVFRPALAADQTHEGIVSKVDLVRNELTMTDKEGDNEHKHVIPATATITLDGKPAALGDLMKGQEITVTTDDQKRVTKIAAKSKK